MVKACLNYTQESILSWLEEIIAKNIGDTIPIYMIWCSYTINTKIVILICWNSSATALLLSCECRNKSETCAQYQIYAETYLKIERILEGDQKLLIKGLNQTNIH